MRHVSFIAQLRTEPVCGYLKDDTAAAEPTALAALALASHGEQASARDAAKWLALIQAADGSVPVRRDMDGPRWPTSLAVLAWQVVGPGEFADSIERAVNWMLSIRGRTQPRSPEIHHDPTLVAWPWVEGTHSWVEPTALHVLALKSVGQGDHRRVREAVRMLVDRQIPGGGCNYGNTGVLGQLLRPHIQPTGVALWALGGETLGAGRVTASIRWLQRAIGEGTSSISLAWALLGLNAQQREHPQAMPANVANWIETAQARCRAGSLSSYKAALLLLAAGAVAGRNCLSNRRVARDVTNLCASNESNAAGEANAAATTRRRVHP